MGVHRRIFRPAPLSAVYIEQISAPPAVPLLLLGAAADDDPLDPVLFCIPLARHPQPLSSTVKRVGRPTFSLCVGMDAGSALLLFVQRLKTPGLYPACSSRRDRSRVIQRVSLCSKTPAQ